MSSKPFNCRWGIIATGSIAVSFCKDLLADPASRSVTDVSHSIVAVSSSSSVDKAKDFIKQVGADSQSCKAFGNYQDMVNQSDCDIVYVATPHTMHYDNTIMCLNAGKNVCLEKPATINAKQFQHLVKLAKSKNLFLMEAVWTRFFPIVAEIKNLIHEQRVLGPLHRCLSDFSMFFPEDPEHRIYKPSLGGGALLDLGIYALTWQMILLFEDPANERVAPKIDSSLMKSRLTGVDEFVSFTLSFEKMHAQGVGTTTSRVSSDNDKCVTIQGEKGDLTIQGLACQPKSYTIRLKDEKGNLGEPKTKSFDTYGRGMHWEADACARALRDGKKELDLCRLNDTLLTMQIMDTIRKNGDFSYPKELEDVKE